MASAPALPEAEQLTWLSQVAAMVAAAIVAAIVGTAAALKRGREPESPFSGQPVNDQQFQQVVLSSLKTLAEEMARMGATTENTQHTLAKLTDAIESLARELSFLRGWLYGGRQPPPP